MRNAALTVIVAALLACTAFGVVASARADSEATRIIDRTFQCAVMYRGGEYILENRAHAGARRNGTWSRLPYASFRTGLAAVGTGNLLAWVTAGKPTASSTVDDDYDTFTVRTVGTVGIRREACRQTTARVPLTTAGLSGGAAAPLGDQYECAAPRQVIVRVRAALAATGRLNDGDDFLVTHVPVREAKLAVRTLAGKPLAYAEVFESGKTKLFAARGCTAG